MQGHTLPWVTCAPAAGPLFWDVRIKADVVGGTSGCVVFHFSLAMSLFEEGSQGLGHTNFVFQQTPNTEAHPASHMGVLCAEI